MGGLFRFPYYVMGMIFWVYAGLFVMLVQFMILPIGVFFNIMIPSFHFSVMDVLTFKTYRNGFKNLNRFLNGF